jgi:hypothetical protein
MKVKSSEVGFATIGFKDSENFTGFNEHDNFLRPAHKSGPLLRADFRPSSERRIQSFETGTLAAHFLIQKYRKVDLTYENQFTVSIFREVWELSTRGTDARCAMVVMSSPFSSFLLLGFSRMMNPHIEVTQKNLQNRRTLPI